MIHLCAYAASAEIHPNLEEEKNQEEKQSPTPVSYSSDWSQLAGRYTAAAKKKQT